ncbi:MAG: alcohol dehydrogenase catalytic domain-containing protein [Nitrospirae bacterium]|nr:alcohol dehydrogenase catalytic domain-containing protein [Nitrospirota bacterium]
MKAIVKTDPRPGLEMVSVDVPSIKHDEILVKVRAASICGTDLHIYKWNSWAQNRIKSFPLITGHEFAGDVVNIGEGVSGFSIGDYVTADSHIVCGHCLQCRVGQQHICSNLKILGVDTNGSFAEYIAIPYRGVWKNDINMPLEFASVQDPLGNALYATLVEPVTGKSVLIIGDGPIGLFSAGIARAAGASWIGLIGHNKPRLEVAKKMGADVVFLAHDKPHPHLNPLPDGEEISLPEAAFGDRETQENSLPDTKWGSVRVGMGSFSEGVDIVLEMSGSPEGFEQGLKLLRKGGRISTFGIFSNPVTVDITNQIIFKGITLYGINGRILFDTWYRMHNLLKSGRLDISPVITHKLPFGDFEKGFQLLLERPKTAVKVVLMMDNG